ncbi:hypothetical protein J6590_058943 [Homalodisca vitripennis]|nr:hypothetical protein J6590_058943 [Homalodisca vitripennis]
MFEYIFEYQNAFEYTVYSILLSIQSSHPVTSSTYILGIADLIKKKDRLDQTKGASKLFIPVILTVSERRSHRPLEKERPYKVVSDICSLLGGELVCRHDLEWRARYSPAHCPDTGQNMPEIGFYRSE